MLILQQLLNGHQHLVSDENIHIYVPFVCSRSNVQIAALTFSDVVLSKTIKSFLDAQLTSSVQLKSVEESKRYTQTFHERLSSKR